MNTDNNDNNGGWVKIYYKLLDWSWHDNAYMLSLFVHCILLANYKDKEWHGITIKRGQFVTSVSALEREIGATRPTILKYLKLLENEKIITRKVTNKYSLITICNYERYQNIFESDLPQRLPQDLPQRLPNIRRKERKERKEKENTASVQYLRKHAPENFAEENFTFPSREQVKDFCQSEGLQIDSDKFFNHYQSREWKIYGKPMDWHARARLWAEEDKQKKSQTSSSVRHGVDNPDNPDEWTTKVHTNR